MVLQVLETVNLVRNWKNVLSAHTSGIIEIYLKFFMCLFILAPAIQIFSMHFLHFGKVPCYFPCFL